MIKKYFVLFFLAFSWFLSGALSSHASEDDNTNDISLLKSVIEEISNNPKKLTKNKKECTLKVCIDYDNKKFIDEKLSFFLYKYVFNQESSKLYKSVLSPTMYILFPKEYSVNLLRNKYTEETESELKNWHNIQPVTIDIIKEVDPILFNRYVNYERKNILYVGFQ